MKKLKKENIYIKAIGFTCYMLIGLTPLLGIVLTLIAIIDRNTDYIPMILVCAVFTAGLLLDNNQS